MKKNLRKKIILFSIIINLMIATSLGFALFRFAGGLYYNSFIESKQSLARSIALSIDGDRHKTFNSMKATSDPEYKKYLRYMNNIKNHEQYITYLFSISYDKKNDKLTYIVDSDILQADTVWITSPYFGMALSIGRNDEILIKYNEEIYNSSFKVKINNRSYPVVINSDGVITLDGKELVRVVSRGPLALESRSKRIDISHREALASFQVNDMPVEIYYSFTAKDESQSMPGELYMESKIVQDRCKQIIESQRNTVETRTQQTSIYGENLSTVYGVIRDSKGIANGLVVIELFHREIANFKSSMLMVALGVSLLTFIITFIVSWLLADYLTAPILKLTKGARKVSDGDLQCAVDIDRSDELGELASTFNNMVMNLRNSSDRLVSANDELTRANQLKDEFLANTSHELKTPLTGIIGIAESLIDGAAGNVSNDQRTNLEMIVLSGRRLTHLVNDILDFSRMKNNDLSLHKKPVDLKQVTELVTSLISPLMGGKPVKIINSISPAIQPVYADENRLQQIMYNLVGNAVKFTDTGTIKIDATANDKEVTVSVTDTGIGIPEERIHEIFDYFKQLDSTDARSYGGTGLGLAITKSLVELHGGTLSVSSRPGYGSEFRFSLPLSHDTPVVQTESQSVFPRTYFDKSYKNNTPAIITDYQDDHNREKHRNHPLNNATILIVDDEPVNVKVIENQLSLEGYKILTADNGMDALNIISRNAPDLVILDVMMPRMTGYHVCSLIREKYSLYSLPVLLLTAKNTIQDIVAGFEAGANDYLAKPFNRRELIARADMLITLKEAVRNHDKYENIQRELEIARRIQNSILPEKLPQVKGLDIQVAYLPMDLVGGDLYDFHTTGDQGIGVLVADVSGHGIPAALISSMVKIAFYTQTANYARPDEMLMNIHKTIQGKCETHFVAASYIYLDHENKKMLHSNAGHSPLIILKKDTGEIITVQSRGKILGLLDIESIEMVELPIEKGYRIILYTDCVIETRNSSDELFGEEQFYNFVRETAASSAEIFVNLLPERLEEWSGTRGVFEDDLTIVVIDII